MTGLENVGGTPTNPYFDQTYRLADGTVTRFIYELDLTPMLSPLTAADLYFRNDDNFVLSFTFSFADWSTLSSCSLLGGLVSTSMTQHAYCQTTGNNAVIILRNFKGFEIDPLLPITKNIRVKFLLVGGSLTGTYTSTSRSITVALFSNYDAYANSYTAIVRKSATQAENCYYPDVSSASCYYDHTSGGGNFYLEKVTDTFLQVSYNPTSNVGFGGGNTYHYFQIKFKGFNYGSTCQISNIVAEISTSRTPGTGNNNTATPTNLQCYGDRVLVYFENIVFANIWGGLSAAANDNTFATTEYIILYLTIAPGSDVELPALHHEYIYAVGVYDYYISFHTWLIRKVAFLPAVSLATSVAISTLSTNRDGVT